MRNWTFKAKAPQGTLYAYQRAITLIVIGLLIGAMALLPSQDPGLGREDAALGIAMAAATGFASWFAPLWRILVGALVVFPMDIHVDGGFRTDAAGLANGFIESVVYTWVLPYLDPEARFWRWASSGQSKVKGFFKHVAVYVGYGALLLAALGVVYGLALCASESSAAIAGFASEDSTAAYVIGRLGASATLGLSVFLLAAFVLGVPYWRSRNAGIEFPEPRREPAELPDVVAAAVSDTASKQP